MALSFPLRRLTALLAATVALSACQDTVCPANMTAPPVFMLAFSADTVGSSGLGFRRAELRTAYLVRYRTADFQQPFDTLRQLNPKTPNSTTPVLSIYYPAGQLPQFAVSDYVSLSTFARSFRLLVPAVSRTYDINNIVLKQEPGETRCAGERITRREATVNGQLRDGGLNNPPELTR